MGNLKKEEIKRWVDIWQKAGSSLEEIKFNELRSANYYKKIKHY